MTMQPVVESRSCRATATPLARLGANHGYRFDGDRVRLGAMFTVLDDAAHARAWTLQLWACPQAPISATDLQSGHLVAEAALPPIGEIADDTHGFEVSSFACPPATVGGHAMVLVLAASNKGAGDGEVQDLAVYAARQAFLQPRMRGIANYRIEDNRVQISVEHIGNARSADTVSGTLSLELWALTAPYAGGRFEGVSLAGTTLGAVSGHYELTLSEFNLPFTPPGAGTWHFTLMLREWTAAGFVTRDFVSFIPPVTCASTPTPEPVANTVVEAASTAVTSAPAVAASAAASTIVKAAIASATPSAAIAAKTAARKQKSFGKSSKTVSINPASVEKQPAKGLQSKSRKA